MAWTTGTTSGTRDYHNLATKLLSFVTAENASAVALNNAGTGYTAGDILTITHASAYHDLKIEVLTIGGGGAIATFKIRQNGAFAAHVLSATVSAGGSNYAVGDYLQVDGGTWTQRAVFTVATLSGSAAATVTLHSGGAYSAFPSNPAATTKVGPTAGTGSGATLTLTTQAIIGTTGIAVTGGTGTTATFDLTLTDTGWTAVRNRFEQTINSITDERDIILRGDSGGNNDPHCGIRTYTQTSGITTRYGWLLFGMDTYNDALATTSQINVGPATSVGTTGVNLLMFNAAESFWFAATGSRIVVIRKAQGGATLVYTSAYMGFMNRFGTEVEAPYPMYLSGSASVSNRAPDDGAALTVTGLTELYSSDTNKAAYYRHPGTGAWTQVWNNNSNTDALAPLGFTVVVTSNSLDAVVQKSDYEYTNVFSASEQNNGAAASQSLLPALGTDQTMLLPCVVKSSPSNSATQNDVDTALRGELDGVFWISAVKADGTNMTSEDTITDGANLRYRVFPNGARSTTYSYFVVAEE